MKKVAPPKERRVVEWAQLTRQKYELLIEPLRETARAQGYALTVHGSLARDIDLVAVPWVKGAISAPVLVRRLIATVRRLNDGIALVINDHSAAEGDERRRNPTSKPHGRLAWCIHLGGGPYIDLSVMPRAVR